MFFAETTGGLFSSQTGGNVPVLSSNGWKKSDFDVIAQGGPQAVNGWSRNDFGIYEQTGGMLGGVLSYLIHIPTGDLLSVFSDHALVNSATWILEQLGDWSEAFPVSSQAVVEAWMNAGFYTTGDFDISGNQIWHWSPAAAREGAGSA